MKKVLKKLAEVQSELKVGKNQRNKFGNYNYRSAEDILEALKPLSSKKKMSFHLTEELVVVGGSLAVESVATAFDIESGEEISSKASAIIDLQQKGMHKPQQTGSASSYAKKYALGNLLLIDDTKDADATNEHQGETEKPKEAPASKPTSTSKPNTTSKPSPKKKLNKAQTDNFLKGIKEGKFDLVEKHLKNYAVDVNSRKVTEALKEAKTGK
ncbi:Erf-like ssDNA annealing protein [Maribacter phage Panino]